MSKRERNYRRQREKERNIEREREVRHNQQKKIDTNVVCFSVCPIAPEAEKIPENKLKK